LASYVAPATFPPLSLAGIEGQERPLAEAWQQGPALIVVGHSGCDTTRFILPYLERAHREHTRGTALAILQDEPEEARSLAQRLGLTVPIALDRPPYPLVATLALPLVPVVFLVGEDGRVEAVSEAFRRADLEAFAQRLGVPEPFFRPGEKAPALRPG
jgi:hypothetical protein